MVPVLGTIVRALHHPRAARVDGRMMCAALRRGAEQRGVQTRAGSVDEVRAGSPADGRRRRRGDPRVGGRDRGWRVDAPAR